MSRFFTIKKKNKGSQKKPLFIIVSKNSFKKAVERNKVKRRIRSIIKPLEKELRFDITIIPNKEFLEKKAEDAKKEIVYTFKHERIIL